MHRVAQEVLLVFAAGEVGVGGPGVVAQPADALVVRLALGVCNALAVVPGAMHRKDGHERLEPCLAAHAQEAGEIGVLFVSLREVLTALHVIARVLLPVRVVYAEVVRGAGGVARCIRLLQQRVPIRLAGGRARGADGAFERRARDDARKPAARAQVVGEHRGRVVRCVQHGVAVDGRRCLRVHAQRLHARAHVGLRLIGDARVVREPAVQLVGELRSELALVAVPLEEPLGRHDDHHLLVLRFAGVRACGDCLPQALVVRLAHVGQIDARHVLAEHRLRALRHLVLRDEELRRAERKMAVVAHRRRGEGHALRLRARVHVIVEACRIVGGLCRQHRADARQPERGGQQPREHAAQQTHAGSRPFGRGRCPRYVRALRHIATV